MARYSPLFLVITLFAVTVLICLVMSSSVTPAQVLEVDEQQHGAGKRVQRVLGCVPAPRSLLSPPSAAPLSARFAIGIQANAEYVHKWQKTLAAYAPEVRAQLAIFILGHDRSAPEALDAAFAKWRAEEPDTFLFASTHSTRQNDSAFPDGCPGHPYVPPVTDTWTTGRNVLARTMYAADVGRGRQFEWWAFLDGDTAVLSCKGCNATAPNPERSVCCFSHLLNIANGYRYALVGNTGYPRDRVMTALTPGPRNFSEWDAVAFV